MRSILNLLKLQIDNKTDVLKTASPRKMIASILKTVIILLLTTAVTAFVLLKIFSLGIRITDGLLAIVLLFLQAIALFFAIGNIINVLYLSKDNEMLICLPITPNQLFTSKVLLIYIREISTFSKISLPLFITLGILGEFGLSFYLSMPILVLLLPILPIVLACFISIPVMAVLRFLKKHAVLAILSTLLLVSTCLWVYVSLIGSIAGNFNAASQQLETAIKINKVITEVGNNVVLYIQLAQAGLNFSKWYFYLIFLAICAIASVLTLLIIRPFYFKIAMSSMENTIMAKGESKPLRKTSPFFSLIKKEMLCIFRSPTDVFEYFLFTLLMPFIVFSYDKLLTTITVNQAGKTMIAGAHVMVVGILAMLSNVASASAISRDGENFYFSKTVPVNYYTQIFAKLVFNAMLTTVAIIVTAIISFFNENAVWWQIVLGSVSAIFASIGHIAWSIDMDVKNPTVNAQGDQEASTTSKSTPKCIIIGMLIGFILGIIVILMSNLKNVLIPFVLIVVLSLAFAINRVYYLILRINLCYDKIEM